MGLHLLIDSQQPITRPQGEKIRGQVQIHKDLSPYIHALKWPQGFYPNYFLARGGAATGTHTRRFLLEPKEPHGSLVFCIRKGT